MVDFVVNEVVFVIVYRDHGCKNKVFPISLELETFMPLFQIKKISFLERRSIYGEFQNFLNGGFWGPRGWFIFL